MKTILCFGDSNTWGYDPDSGTRLPYQQRWPTVMQGELREEFLVIPEGLNGRTTVFDDPFVPGRNGAAALPMLLDTHAPLDLVVIMLGTNDVKRYFSVSPAQIARGMERLVSLVAVSDAGVNETAPTVLVVAPVPLAPMNGDMLPHFAPEEEAIRASRELAQSYKRMTAELGCSFFDGATAGVAIGSDGVHLDRSGQRALGVAIAREAAALLNSPG